MNVFLTRHPIFYRDGSTYAYELLYRDEEQKEAAPGENKETDGFFGIDVLGITGGERVFINFTDELIAKNVPWTFSPEILVVEVSAERAGDRKMLDTVKALKEHGYSIAVDGYNRSDEYKELFSFADIIKVDAKAPKELIEEAESVCYKAGKPMLAKNVNTNADFESAVRQGFKYLQGYFYARSSVVAGGTLQPLPVNLIEAMRLMALPEPEIKDIVDVMSRDAALCQKILKLINSVYFGVSHRVSSINQAILILGLDYLREWVYLMGMQKISQNDCIEVMRLALLIAKLCRGLSEFLPGEEKSGEAFYLMGLLSMIVLSSDRALAQALDEFPLTNDIKKGLLRCGGVYSDVFEMALSYVDGRWDDYGRLAAKYEISSDKVNEMFLHSMQEIGMMNMS